MYIYIYLLCSRIPELIINQQGWVSQNHCSRNTARRWRAVFPAAEYGKWTIYNTYLAIVIFYNYVNVYQRIYPDIWLWLLCNAINIYIFFMLQFSTRFMSFGEIGGMSIFRDWSSLVKHQSPPRIAGKIGNWWEQSHMISDSEFSENLNQSFSLGGVHRIEPFINQNPSESQSRSHVWSFLMLFFIIFL